MNDQDFDFQSPQDPKDPKSQVSPAMLAALGATLVLAGGYYFWNSSSNASPTAAEPIPVAAPARPVTAATPPKAPTASAPPTASTPRTEAISKEPVAASQTIAPTPTTTPSGALIPASNAQFLTNQAIKIAGREDPFKSAAAPVPTPPSPVASKPPIGPPPPLPLPTTGAPVAPAAPGPVASTIPIKGIFQVQQDAYVVVGHEGGDEILRAGEYLDSPEQVQVVNISPSAHTITFREKGQDIVRNVAASP
jgi:hypothetical protein